MFFEVKHTDLAARIGKFDTPHGSFETPAFIPVIHPINQQISPSFLKRLGFNCIITNAYITFKKYKEKAKKYGIHNIVNFDGPIMTDSGGYQVLEYGSVQVSPSTMAQFELDIGSDIPVPLDKPTGYGLPYSIAKSYVNETISNIEETISVINKNKNNSDCDSSVVSSKGEIWTGTIQGAEHFDLVKYSASTLDKMGFYFFAIGSPVELMESYNFSILSQLIKTTKMSIPNKPIHLFGAGHPLTIPLAVALGCDTFDSASYILYAKDNRYMHSHGTLRLEDLSYFPCCCQICSYYTVKELLNEDRETRIINLAKHNLFVLKQEISFIKQSIYDGRLWEYVLQKSRSHPKLRDAMYEIKNFDYLQNCTPLFKQKAIYLFEPIDQYRPELKNFRDMLINNYKPLLSDSLLLYPDQGKRPFYLSSIFKNLIDGYSPSIMCLYNPFFGLIPVEMSDIFPASHNVISAYSGNFEPRAYDEFINLFNSFIKKNFFKTVFIFADLFMKKQLPFLQFPDEMDVKIQDFDYKNSN
ncbi:MAG: tRNA guanosine(15) transglycosylase TgtA [Candidatus Nitrosocosmicus sp.]